MTRIRVRCSDCDREVEVPVDQVRVLVVGTVDDFVDAAYRFPCPGCGETVTRTAHRKTVALLVDVGCRVDESAPAMAGPWHVTSWTGRLDCGHDVGGKSGVPPTPGDPWDCDLCAAVCELVDVIEGRKVAA